jgi:hypothetical protein
MDGACSTYGESRCVYKALVRKAEINNALGRPRRRWEDNINMDLQDMGCEAWAGSIWLRISTGGGHL